MLEKFCGFLVERGRAENTISSYRQAVGDYMKWYQATFGEPMTQLYRINVLDYISYLRNIKRLTNRSINAKLSALQSFNDYLIEAGAQTDTVLTESDHLKVQIGYAKEYRLERPQNLLLPLSGMSAISRCTILSDNAYPTYAATRTSMC